MTRLPEGFVHPARCILTTGHHLRPIRGTDVFLDFPAVMGSQASLWSLFGGKWGWPSPTMTIGQDLDDLVRHEWEMESQQSYNYCILDKEESQLSGCVYLDPPDADSPPAVDAEICWWASIQQEDRSSRRPRDLHSSVDTSGVAVPKPSARPEVATARLSGLEHRRSHRDHEHWRWETAIEARCQEVGDLWIDRPVACWYIT
jgi:hypothetical protein